MNFINESFHSLFLRSLRTGGGGELKERGVGETRFPIVGRRSKGFQRGRVTTPSTQPHYEHGFTSFHCASNRMAGYKWLPLSHSTVETLMPFREKKKFQTKENFS
ncbi:hypothetical protein CDAR_546971 [Caerostris darwini]|uniref:Uncharacterized protein n=1 Tax=Caerostris darwini TaxID=1538125 RepID=A0AAV4SWW5_9ARAC|nr:hypothetical protein CDAR_546971 [Caerostris darwini]